MKFKTLKDLYSGKFFSKDDNNNMKWEQFICIGQDGKLYEQVNFEEFIPYKKPLIDSDGNDNNTEDALETMFEEALDSDVDFAELASGENEGEKYTVTLVSLGKAEMFVQGKNAAGEDDWFPPRGNCDELEKWVGFITLPDGIEWA